VPHIHPCISPPRHLLEARPVRVVPLLYPLSAHPPVQTFLSNVTFRRNVPPKYFSCPRCPLTYIPSLLLSSGQAAHCFFRTSESLLTCCKLYLTVKVGPAPFSTNFTDGRPSKCFLPFLSNRFYDFPVVDSGISNKRTGGSWGSGSSVLQIGDTGDLPFFSTTLHSTLSISRIV